MKKRMLSWLLALAMIAALVPGAALAAPVAWDGTSLEEPVQVDGVYQIATASQLAWLAQEVNAGAATASAVLTADIDLGGQVWTPIGLSSAYPYSGSFDGQGCTVSGLFIDNSSAGDQGLFGYVKDATIRSVTVEGQVTGGGSGTASGVGGLIGTLAGYSGQVVIENCVNKATVSGNQNVAGIAGLITGSGAKTIRSCADLGTVTANVSNAGGIVGNFYYKCTVEDCYDRGTVTASVGNAGGIAGLLNDYGVTVRRCYTTQAVAVGKKSSGSVETATVFCQGTDPLATQKSDQEMREAAFTAALGDAFLPGSDANDGYPILSFQVVRYPVTFTISPAQAEVSISGAAGEHAGDAWTFRLPAGTYPYTVSAFGYETAEDQLTVTDGPVSEMVALTELESKSLSFLIDPADVQPTITLTWQGRAVTPEEDGSYRLPYGDYHYIVKARGYAAAQSDLTVSATSPATIPVTLQPSTAWDGESFAQPQGSGAADDPYRITCGEELAWLAQQVNDQSKGDQASAILMGDIDLGEHPWTPMGNSYSVRYKSVFDGQGHTVSGLNVTGGEYAGLFGQTEKATIRNLVVRGQVTGTGRTAGVVGYAYADCLIQNCGNEAAVTGTGNWTAGVVGYIGSYSDQGSSIVGCYNAGPITSQGGAYGYAGGILGYDYVGEDVTFTDCYNTDSVTSGGYAGGIRGYGSSMAGAMVNCYNAGTVTGGEGKTGAIAPSASNKTANCYYLDTGADSNENVAAKTALELQQPEFLALLSGGRETWKQNSAMNNGYPVLTWQKEPQPLAGGEYELTESAFIWQAATDPDTGESVGQITPYLQWKPVAGAESYTVTLFDQSYHPTENGQDYTVTERQAAAVQDVSGVSVDQLPQDQSLETEEGWLYLDLTQTLSQLGDGRYHAAVTPTGTAQPDLAYAQEHLFGYDVPYNRLSPVTGLAWDGTRATWTPKAGFGAGDAYVVTVYKLDGNGEVLSTHIQSVPGSYSRVDCSGSFAVGGRYAFSVTALADGPMMEALNYSDSLDSRRSDDPAEAGAAGVYTVTQAQRPGGEHDQSWTAITTAREWIDLANVEDVDDVSGDPDSNRQKTAWGKKYYLADDIDFSGLDADYAARTKSIGNVTHRFMGTLDGNGHKLTGLTLSGGDRGLFEYVGSTGCVYGLTVEGANLQTSDNAGVIARNNFGTIERCAVIRANITSDTGAIVGGMVSRNYGLIQDSCVQGGLLNAASITATGHAGFAGANEYGGVIQRCWTSMDVQTQSDYAGGFVGLCYGETDDPSLIRDCFALGDVSARSYSGGFVGRSVYEDCRYENCYAAGVVTVTDTEGHGFIGGNKPDSAFQYDQSHGVQNCYYNAASPADDNCPGGGKTLAEMQTADFARQLNAAEELWLWDESVNSALPYLKSVQPPVPPAPETITVTVVLATYDKREYAFVPMGQPISVTLPDTGNTRVTDVLDAAQDQGALRYTYATTATMGRYIHTINDYAVTAPDGWMFTVNDVLSNVSASLAVVHDGDTVLWFEGTTENRYLPPTLDELAGSAVDWTDLATVDDLLALARSEDDAVLAKHYRLTADVDLSGVDFPGIGSAQHPFTGVFHGAGHTVANMTRSGEENVGFVNVLKGGMVKELTLKNVSVTGQRNVGALVGWAQAVLDPADPGSSAASLVGGCAVVGGTVSGQSNVGGGVGCNGADADSQLGLSTASAVDRCAAHVTVSGDGDKIGGLVGDNQGNITRAKAAGAVNASGAAMVGGLVGDNSGAAYDSHAAVTVTGGNVVGGFAGSSSGVVERSYALGSVTAQSHAGGFAGSLARADTVLSTGTVTAQDYVGALAGTLTGKLVGLAAQVTVKNAFAYCPEGHSPIGNTSQFSGESNAAVLATMSLADADAVAHQAKDLFDLDLAGGEPVDQTALMDAIAAKLTQSDDSWTVMDLARYSALPGKTAATTAQARQSCLDALIATAAGETATVSDRARIEIVLRAMGVDSKELYPAGKTEAVDNAGALAAMDLTIGGHYAAPYVLLAARQGNVQLTQTQTDSLVKLLADGVGDGLFEWEWDGTTYTDPDTAGAALAALASYDTAEARSVKDKILAALPGALGEGGTFGSANSDAMVILGLLAVGQDPRELKTEDGASVVDGLLSYVNETRDGFVYAGAENALATEQGFRALVALAMYDGEGSVDFYDFSTNAVTPGKATGAEGPDRPKPPTPSGDKTVAVTFTLKTHTETWVSATTLKLTQGATVYHALTKVMAANGITAVGADAGYVTSMTYRGKTLAEFDNGPNSGWLYQVNGQAPNVPFNAYTLKDGDEVLWYYAADWTRDPAASRPISGGHGGSVGVGGKENETTEEPEKPQETDKTIWPFADVTEGEWFYPGVKTVYEKGLVMGTDASHFSPDMTTTRAMVLTILARLDTQDLSGGDAWYDKAVAWAVNKGVSDGTAPEHDITREQLAAMLMRYAGETPPENTGLDAFSDAGAVSDWARPAMVWATDRGILTGKPGSRLDPQGQATRAELCAVLHRYLTGEKGPAPQQPDLRAQMLAQKAGAAASWLLKAVPEPQVGDVGGEWTVLALAQSGSADRDYLNAYLAAAKDTVAAKGGRLTSRKYTEYSRLVLTLTALGADPRDVAGYDLTAPLCDYDAVVRQGLNGAIWALMALDSGAYSDDQTRQKYVELLLERQLPQGGWSLTGEGEPEADVTGMVLRALAPHRGQERVDQAVERALEALSAQQNADGSFSSWGQPTAESCAQVILALDALDMELRDARFVKNGCTALDGLLGFCTQDGGFAHTTGGKADLMATEQALLALAACLD